MKPLRFCAACGSGLEAPDSDDGAGCPKCGRFWYRNAAPTAGAAIIDGDRALVTVRARDPERGKCDVAGGFLEFDEDPVAGLKREVAEEVGVEIEVGIQDLVQAVPHAYGDDGEWVLSLGFKARFVAGEPVPADDVAAVRWVRLAELDDLEWAWAHDKELVRKALEHGH